MLFAGVFVVSRATNSPLMEAVATPLEELTYEQERGKPMPSKNHAIIQSRLVSYFDRAYGDRLDALSELSLQLPDQKVVPDLAIYLKVEFDPLNDEISMSQIPLGVVEIISPSQGQEELIEKARRYFAGGVQSYWLVNPTFKLIHLTHDARSFRTVTEGVLRDEVLGVEVELGVVFR